MKLFDNLLSKRRMSSRRLLLKQAKRSGAGASDVKKAKDDLAKLNFISWLASYMH